MHRGPTTALSIPAGGPSRPAAAHLSRIERENRRTMSGQWAAGPGVLALPVYSDLRPMIVQTGARVLYMFVGGRPYCPGPGVCTRAHTHTVN